MISGDYGHFGAGPESDAVGHGFAGTSVAPLLAVGPPTVFATFPAARTARGERRNASLGGPGALRATVGRAVHPTLLCLISAGDTVLPRSTVALLGSPVPPFFVVSDSLAKLPGVGAAVCWRAPGTASARCVSGRLRSARTRSLQDGAGVGTLDGYEHS
ncbi:hypothetical protein [Streptomyces sp. NPDC058653]|uniref:hypothetical protein n=1 Tax=Streptomyces sp. NPDC058653 TaxID=3346576 RepID=UPI003651D565